ncbi:hypothetical protein TNCV_4094871 [Trichonephila clavipes]|uniref:Uncharacterized protein n=1 Tax=Trichonephila clavipes TaxID=2585209 RepID=A0A8X6SE88_TRICX|nr:hypothetical protein TNCV_4094871 [Trichonephila clavipes]
MANKSQPWYLRWRSLFELLNLSKWNSRLLCNGTLDQDSKKRHQLEILSDNGMKKNKIKLIRAVSILVIRASDSRSKGLDSMPVATKYPPSTHGVRARQISGSESLVGCIHECRRLENISLRFSSMPKLGRWRSLVSPSIVSSRISPRKFVLSPEWCSRLWRTTGVHQAPCHDEFRGHRSDYVRQVALATTTTVKQKV